MIFVNAVVGKQKTLSMLYGSARYVKKFGGRLNFAKAICPVVLLASEIYSLAFFNLKNQILPRFSLMLLGLYGRRGMHQDWVTFPFLTKKFFVDATERMQEFQAVQIDQPTIASILGPTRWSPPPSLFLGCVCLQVKQGRWKTLERK